MRKCQNTELSYTEIDCEQSLFCWKICKGRAAKPVLHATCGFELTSAHLLSILHSSLWIFEQKRDCLQSIQKRYTQSLRYPLTGIFQCLPYCDCAILLPCSALGDLPGSSLEVR